MAQFEIEYSYTTYDTDYITVEAENEDEARDIAFDEIMWKYDDVEITDVEEV